MLDYEKDVRIDPDALDVEWLNQSEIMLRYALHAADMRKAVDEAKERLEAGKAKIELSIRTDPEAYGLAKVTEAGIQSTILIQKEYSQLVVQYNEAKYENDIATGAVRAIDQKKTALENLVRLLGVSYFAGPQAPRNLHEEYLEKAERRKANSKVKVSKKKGKKEG